MKADRVISDESWHVGSALLRIHGQGMEHLAKLRKIGQQLSEHHFPARRISFTCPETIVLRRSQSAPASVDVLSPLAKRSNVPLFRSDREMLGEEMTGACRVMNVLPRASNIACWDRWERWNTSAWAPLQMLFYDMRRFKHPFQRGLCTVQTLFSYTKKSGLVKLSTSHKINYIKVDVGSGVCSLQRTM